MSRIRVLIADDHALVRAALRALLAPMPDFEVVGEADDGVVVVEQCKRLTPDVVLLDLFMPGRSGVAALEDLRQACPTTKLLVVTMCENASIMRQSLMAGAAGYVLKSSVTDELISAIRAVCQGRQYVTPALDAPASESDLPDRRPERNAKSMGSLTPRELEVVVLVALGQTTAEIARNLHVTEKTVETHRKHIMTKLDLHTRAGVVRFALEHKLIGS